MKEKANISKRKKTGNDDCRLSCYPSEFKSFNFLIDASILTTPKANIQPKMKPTKIMYVVKNCSSSFLKNRLWPTKLEINIHYPRFVDWNPNHIIY